MAFKFFPKEESFYEAFNRQAKILEEAAFALRRLLEEYQNIESQVKNIEDLERKGDTIVRDVSLRLYKVFVTPIDREDIHELVGGLDDVLDYIRAAAVRLLLFGVKGPRPPAHSFATLLVKATAEITKAIDAMEHHRDVTIHTSIIKSYEKEGDRVNRDAISGLFHEKIPELEIIQWMAVYDRLETALDCCQDVAQIIEGVMLKNG